MEVEGKGKLNISASIRPERTEFREIKGKGSYETYSKTLS